MELLRGPIGIMGIYRIYYIMQDIDAISVDDSVGKGNAGIVEIGRLQPACSQTNDQES